MSGIPAFREEQHTQIIAGIEAGIRIILASGPISSGKTFVLQKIANYFKNEKQYQVSHILCDAGDDSGKIFTQIVKDFKNEEQPKKIRSFRAFTQAIDNSVPSLVIFDSFDLLESYATEFFSIASASVETLDNMHFIFVSRVRPSFYTPHQSGGLMYFHISFPSYTREEIISIITEIHPDKKNPNFNRFLSRLIDVVEPITNDLRDIIFISHTVDVDQVKALPQDFAKLIFDQIKMMKIQSSSRINDLPTTAVLLLLATYLASHTTPTSDFLRFTRTLKRKTKATKMLEDREFVPLQRVFALAKALVPSCSENFEFGYALFVEVQQLIAQDLIEIRGDFMKDPKVKCLASESEIDNAAELVKIQIREYIVE